jgi:hypothetical protein
MLPDSILHAAAAHPVEMPITCGRYLNREAYLDKVLAIPFGYGREEKLKSALSEVDAFIERMKREGITMTTTPQQTTATPKPAAPAASPALAKVQELQDEVAYLRELVIRQHNELKETLTHMAEARGFDRIRTDELHHAVDRVIALLENKPAQAAAVAPQAAPPTTATAADNGGAIEIMQAIAIKKGINEKNAQPTIKITTTDPRFSQYGVTVWPEAAEALGIDLTALHYGSTPFEKKIKVAVNNGKSKAIGLA